jgi:hypothetical protein
MVGDTFGILHIGAQQEVMNIFVLRQDEAVRRMMHLNAKKIAQLASIFDNKFLL